MTTGAFQPRRLGDHLLVAQLGEDCLGTVYRALHSTDERRFVRLRVLQSPELSPPAVFAAISRHADRTSRLSHKTIVQHAELAVADGTPFVAWYEGTGWTLDVVLARLRAAGTRLPVAYGLLIAERVCAALEHAWFSPVDGEPIRHGVLWPGFVSISNDAEIRLGGFGLADAVLPSLASGRLARDVAPYAAPEARETCRVGSQSDVYSVGVLLGELLTGRRPSIASVYPILRAEEDPGEGIRELLDRCFAAVPERLTVLELHRSLQEQLATGPARVSSADLALFLYTLLNPESRGLAHPDADSTNPIAGDLAAASELVPETGDAPQGRRATDGVLIPPPPSASPAFPGPPARGSDLPAEARRAPGPSSRPSRPRWVGGAAYFAAAAAIILGVEALAIRRDRPAAPRGSAPPPVQAAFVPAAPLRAGARAPEPAVEAPAVEPAPAPRVAPESLPRGLVQAKRTGAANAASAVRLAGGSAAATRASRPSVRPADAAAARSGAEDSRFRAAWARIEAERREAGQLAAEPFAAGREAEAEGQRLFRTRDFSAAAGAFDRATSLFRDAENTSRQARLDRIRLSSPSS
ncbi:MAG: protein kinase [Acidobacteriota bacterium]